MYSGVNSLRNTWVDFLVLGLASVEPDDIIMQMATTSDLPFPYISRIVTFKWYIYIYMCIYIYQLTET